jgi:hypothetical protein
MKKERLRFGCAPNEGGAEVIQHRLDVEAFAVGRGHIGLTSFAASRCQAEHPSSAWPRKPRRICRLRRMIYQRARPNRLLSLRGIDPDFGEARMARIKRARSRGAKASAQISAFYLWAMLSMKSPSMGA